MSASSVPSTPALPIRVAAGTTAGDALREAGVELTGRTARSSCATRTAC